LLFHISSSQNNASWLWLEKWGEGEGRGGGGYLFLEYDCALLLELVVVAV
jgi:hypothetical protein